MAILDVRIDDRLIHGQVCGFWIPHYSLERIAIVDDEIVNDEIRKTALKFGCPEKCKLSIFSTVKAADKFIRKIDEGIRVMILCNSPVPILKMAQLGYKAPFVTVGNMSNGADKKRVSKNICVTEADEENFNYLSGLGYKLYSQMVPSEAPSPFMPMLEAALKKS